MFGLTNTSLITLSGEPKDTSYTSLPSSAASLGTRFPKVSSSHFAKEALPSPAGPVPTPIPWTGVA